MNRYSAINVFVFYTFRSPVTQTKCLFITCAIMPFPINDPNDPVLLSLKHSLGLDQPRNGFEKHPNTLKIPLLGEIQFVRDKDGILLLSAIVAYWVYGIWSSYYVIIEPHWRDGYIADWVVYCKYFLLLFFFK